MSGRSSNVFTIDPTHPVPPEDLDAPEPGIGGIVAVLADEGARASGWSAAFAAELATKWAEGGLDVVLADADLAGAELHTQVGAENDEGITDAILYGASRQRVVREGSRCPGISFVPAGTAVVEVSRVYRHPRWATLLSSLRDGRLTLVLYLPAESEGVPELAAQADRVIRLVSGAFHGEGEEGVTFICGPEAPIERATAKATEANAGADSAAEREPLVRTRAPSSPARKGARWKAVLLALLVIVLALLVMGWMGYITI